MATDGMPDIGDPKTIAEATFSTSFRGFDQLEVRAFLQSLSRQVADIEDVRAEAEAMIADARRTAESAQGEIDEEFLTARLGEDAAKILQTARDSAADRIQAADDQASEIRSLAAADAESIRRAAETEADKTLAELTERQTELDALIEAERTVVEDQRRAALTQAQREADEITALARVEGEKLVNDARNEGRAMVTEAKLVRERVLSDLSRRRTKAKVQLEQLRAGRERLMEGIEFASSSVDEVRRELGYSLPAARQAAETAGRTVPAAAPVEEVEREIESARLVGNPIVTDAEVRAAAQIPDAEPVGHTPDEEPTADIASQDQSDEHDEPALPATDEPSEPSASEPAENDPSENDPSENDEEDEAQAAAEPADEVEGGVVLSELGGEGRASVFRRNKPLPPEASRLPKEPVPTIDPAADFEEVRVLDPTVELEVVSANNAAAAIVDLDPTMDEPLAEDSVEEEPTAEVAEPDAESHDAESHDEPTNEELPTEELTAEEHSTEAPEETEASEETGETEEAEASEETEVLGDAEGSDETEGSDEVAAEIVGDEPPDGAGVDDDSVDNLFQRLRADREKRVAKAATVLAAPAAIAVAADSDADEPADPEAQIAPDLAPTDDDSQSPAAADAPAASTRLQQAEAHLATRRRSLAKIEKNAAKALKRHLTDEQNELLDGVRTRASEVSIDAVAGDLGAQSRGYIDAALSALEKAYGAGSGGAGSFNPVDSANQAATEVFTSMRMRIDEILADADSPDAAIDSLRSLYREIKGQRMSDLASNLVVSAYNDGYYEQLDSGGTIRWELAPDSTCGRACTDNVVAPAVKVGTPFPSGHLHPPAAPGCRCLVILEADA